MSSYDKVVKGATKPKAAPPKAKYIDPIIAATYSEEGAIHDVCKALTPKFREPNAIVVFKALIVLHTMIRNGATDNVLAYLSQSDILRLRNVSNGQWEGYSPPKNLANYALYLDYRIRAYKDLKHDPIRVQSESNRDMRVGQMDEEIRRTSTGSGTVGFGAASGSGGISGSNSTNSRRQTIVGRKLRIMSVEKGLLRETRIVQKMIDVLLECKFYLDDLEDELTITALRILVKDLLVLFQAVNEGVINLLEHYFEMSHVDATTALGLYRQFCNQTENVVEYLTIARKLQNLLNVPIPNLKHAPVSLASSLEEYLNDPNFEQNRIEYKTNKEAADQNLKKERTAGRRKHQPTKEEPPPVPKLDQAQKKPETSNPPTAKPEAKKELADFFTSIEQEQQSMFPNQQGPSPQMPFNPFTAPVVPNMTGMPGANPFVNMAGASPFVNVQQTGFPSIAQPTPFPGAGVQPQATGFPGAAGGFGIPNSQSQPFLSVGGANSNSPFARPQSAAPNFAAAGAGGLQPLVPQTTGSNPFRASILMPQSTGFPNGAAPNSNSPFAAAPQPTNPFPSFSAQAPTNSVNSNSPFAQPIPSQNTSSVLPAKITPPFARPQSTPASPVTSHNTGSRNPFGKLKSPPPPPVPPVPTLGQLSTGAFTSNAMNTLSNGSAFTGGAGGSTNTLLPFATGSPSPFNWGNSGNAANSSTANGTSSNPFPQATAKPTGVSLSSVASEFTFDKPKTSSPPPNNPTNAPSFFGSSTFPPLSAQTTSTTNTSTAGPFSTFSSLSSNPTGTSTATTMSSGLKPQMTGFGGSNIKPFKPSSTFGASLLDALPTIPQNEALNTSTPATANASSPNTTPSNQPSFGTSAFGSAFGGTSSLGSQPTGLTPFGSSFGGSNSLQPQATGGNPFRASMFGGAGLGGSPNGSAQPQNTGIAPNPTGFGASLFASKPTGPPQQQPNSNPTNGFSLFSGATTGTSLLNSQPTGAFNMPGAFPSFTQPPQQQPKQQNTTSLI